MSRVVFHHVRYVLCLLLCDKGPARSGPTRILLTFWQTPVIALGPIHPLKSIDSQDTRRFGGRGEARGGARGAHHRRYIDILIFFVTNNFQIHMESVLSVAAGLLTVIHKPIKLGGAACLRVNAHRYCIEGHGRKYRRQYPHDHRSSRTEITTRSLSTHPEKIPPDHTPICFNIATSFTSVFSEPDEVVFLVRNHDYNVDIHWQNTPIIPTGLFLRKLQNTVQDVCFVCPCLLSFIIMHQTDQYRRESARIDQS